MRWKEFLNTLSYKYEGKDIFFIIGFILALSLFEICFLLNSLQRELEPIQILMGSIVICSLGFAIIKPYISIIVFIIVAYYISRDIFGASTIELVSFGGEQLSWVIISIIIFCWIINSLKQRDFRVIIGVQGWLLFAFWIIILISSVFAVDNNLCLEHLRGITIVFFIYFAILNLVKTKEQLILILWTLVIVFGLSAIEANINYFWHGITPAVDPIYHDNNYFAHLLVMVIPVVFYLIFISRSFFLNVITHLVSYHDYGVYPYIFKGWVPWFDWHHGTHHSKITKKTILFDNNRDVCSSCYIFYATTIY